MGHDEHFLSRLHRLEREHLELALGLYHDRALLLHLLSTVRPPDAVERVAINLGDPGRGPWLIVSRDAHFVTCLGAGMQLLPEQYVIERARLDQVSESVEALRELVAASRAGGGEQTRRQLARIGEAGSGLSLGEFDALAQWLPLLEGALLDQWTKVDLQARELGARLRRRKKLRARDHAPLHAYWRASWALSHLAMLLASDGGASLRARCERLAEQHPALAHELVWSLARLGVSPFLVRSAWLASKLPSQVLPLAKRRYLGRSATPLSTLGDAVALVAMGLRHRRYRAEIGKALGRHRSLPPPVPPALEHVHRLALDYHGRHTQLPELRTHTLTLARRFVEQVFSGHPQVPSEELATWPDPLCAAIFMAVPVDVRGEPRAAQALFEWLAWIVGVEARDFYVPEPLVEVWRGPWRPDDALPLLRARQHPGEGARPRRVAPTPARNAPCPCGSGRKYKRCCGA